MLESLLGIIALISSVFSPAPVVGDSGTINQLNPWKVSGGYVQLSSTTASLKVPSLNCTSFTNGGALTADATGAISCSNDDGGAGSATTTLFADGNHWTGIQNFDGGFIARASSTVQSFCIGSDCRTAWPSGGGAGSVVNATGTPGQVAVFSALNALVSTSTIDAASIDATSTSRASVFATLSATNATSSTFAITNALNGLLKTDGNGSVRVATAGTDYQAALGAGTKGQILAYLGAGVPTWTATTTFSTGLTYSAGNVTCDTASGSVFGCLTSAFFTAFNNKISSTSLSAATPLSYNSGTGAFTIADAVANGSTKGAASFTANDFDSSSGNISIDYTNGQAAASGVKGFLTAADWATFSGKESALTFGTLLSRTSNTISGSTSPSFAVLNATSSLTIGTLTGVLKAASGLVSTGADGTDYTLIDALTCSGSDKFSGVTAAGVFTCSADVSGGAGAGFIVNATGTPNQLAVFSGLNSLISTSTLNVSSIDATSTTRSSLFNLIDVITALVLPDGSNPTVDAGGEIAFDSTDNQLLVGDSGGTARPIPLEQPLFAVTVASTSPVFISGGNLPVPRWIKDGRVLTQFRCWVEGGTSVAVQVSDGTNATESITCATTVTSDTDVATNDTFTADEKWYIDFGTVTGTVNFVTFEAYGYITRE